MTDGGADALPTAFGRYEVLGLVGRGAFADVVRCWDASLESHVAIKVLTSESSADALVRERFLEEGRLLRRVRSDSVLAVHDIGELHDGRPYLVLDFAQGGTVGERHNQLQRQPADAAAVAQVVGALATGLNALHDAGVVHRDIKPDNLLVITPSATASADDETRLGVGLVQPDERIVIGDLGLAKDLVARGETLSVVGGSPGFRAPEQHRIDGSVGPAADIYAATAVVWQLLTGTKPPEPFELDDKLALVRPGWQGFFSRGMAADPEERFANIDAWMGAALDQLEVEPVALSAVPVSTQLGRACPYKGLSAFQAEDADVFFGREALVDELLARMQRSRVLVVGGPSGSGKSSLVRAGLLPALSAGALPGSDRWRIDLFTPGADPFGELHYRLTRTLDHKPPVSVEEMREDPRQARRLADLSDDGNPRLIYIDQFEELFTHTDDAGTPAGVVEALASMADPADSTVRIVLAVRADFYDRCAQIGWLAERITENQVLVGPMSTDNMRRAIEEPARRSGLRLEPGLIDAVVDEAGASAGSLPLISHALVETWSRREGNVLTLEGFRAAGGVAGAVAQSADQLFDETFDAAQQQAARRLLLRLITPGDGTADTRRRMSVSELSRDPEPEPMRRTVSAFVNARLLTVDEHVVEIAHEALIGGWPRLRGWIDAERENLRFRQRVGRAAVEWESQNKDPDLLYRGTPLSTALDWARENGDSLDVLEQHFLGASEAARDAAEAEVAHRQARAQRARRLATTALATLAVVSLLAGALAFVLLQRSRESNEEADRSFANAIGVAALNTSEDDPKAGVLLAVESLVRSDGGTFEARSALARARVNLAESPITADGPVLPLEGNLLFVTLSADGTRFATGDNLGTIRLYDTDSGEQLGDDLAAFNEGARSLTFGGDDGRLVAASAEGGVVSWDIRDPLNVPEPTSLFSTSDLVWSVALHPNGQQVAVGDSSGTFTLVDINTGELVAQHRWEDDETDALGVQALAFTPDGGSVILTSRAGWLRRYDLAAGVGEANGGWDLVWSTPNEPATGSGPQQYAKLWELEVSPDGRYLAVAGDRKTAALFDAASGRFLTDVSDRGGLPRGISFNASSTLLLAGDSEGRVHAWDIAEMLEPGAVLAAPATRVGHASRVIEGDVSADGLSYVSLANDESLQRWSLDTPEYRTDLGPLADTAGFADMGGAFGVAGTADGSVVFVGDGDGRVHRLDPEAQVVRSGTNGHASAAVALGVSADATLLASIARDDAEVRIWNAETLELQHTLAGHSGRGRAVAFSPNGEFLASADDQGAVIVRRVSDWSVTHTLTNPGGGETAVAFTPDSSSLLTGGRQATVRVWNLGNGDQRTSWTTAGGPSDAVVRSVAVSSEGLVATADSDDRVQVFDLDGRPADGSRQLSGFEGGDPVAVAFANDGATVVVLTASGSLDVRDWQRGEPLLARNLEAHSGGAQQLWLEAAGNTFVTAGGGDSTVLLWDLLSVERACEVGEGPLQRSAEPTLFADADPIGCTMQG